MYKYLVSAAITAVAMTAQAQIIIVDIAPIAAVTRAIAPDAHVEVTITPDQSAHHFHLLPKQAARLQSDDLFIGIGGNISANLFNARKALNANAPILNFVDDDADGHIWTAPDNLAQVASKISITLGDTTALAATDFQNRMEAIGYRILEQPYDLGIITSHNSLREFERFAGVNNFGSLSDGHDHPINASTKTGLINDIKNNNINCLIIDTNEENHNVIEFAIEHDLKTVEVDVIGAETIAIGDFEAYFEKLSRAYSKCE